MSLNPTVPQQSRAIILLLAALAGLAGYDIAAARAGGDTNEAGKLVYDLRCARCHGPNGRGDGPEANQLIVRPTDFHDTNRAAKTDEQWLASVEFGVVTSPMHAWRGRLSSEELRDVVAYIRYLSQQAR